LTLESRHIPLSGSKNFRDFGGYPTTSGNLVKPGVLFRSDHLSHLSDDDLAILQPLAIRNICDLRRSKERELAPTRWHETSDTQHLHVPLMDEGTSAVGMALRNSFLEPNEDTARNAMKSLYRHMVSSATSLNRLQQIFRLLANTDELPILVHCSGGKDRTGLSCALILWFLGVDRDTVFEDYMLSQTLYTDRIDLEKAASQVFDYQQAGKWSLDAIRPIYSVEPDYLNTALEYIVANFGTIEEFTKKALGLTDQERQQIRINLIEPT